MIFPFILKLFFFSIYNIVFTRSNIIYTKLTSGTVQLGVFSSHSLLVFFFKKKQNINDNKNNLMFPLFFFVSVALPATRPPKKCSVLCLLDSRRNTLKPGQLIPSIEPLNSTKKKRTDEYRYQGIVPNTGCYLLHVCNCSSGTELHIFNVISCNS